MFSPKKFEIVRTIITNGQESSSLLFDHENEQDIINKLNEPAIYEIREELIVRNNHTGLYDYAWRVIVGMQDLRCFDG